MGVISLKAPYLYALFFSFLCQKVYSSQNLPFQTSPFDSLKGNDIHFLRMVRLSQALLLFELNRIGGDIITRNNWGFKMDIYFRSHKLQRIFQSHESLDRKYGTKSADLICRWLTCFRIARSLSEISHDKPTRRHLLQQGTEKQYSIDVAHPFRLLIKAGHHNPPRKRDGGIDETLVTSVMIMGVEDTHDKSWKASKTKFSTHYPLAFQDNVSPLSILNEYIDMHSLSPSGFASQCNVSAETIDKILSNQVKIDEKTARQLETATAISQKVWLGTQSLHPEIDLFESDDEEDLEPNSDKETTQTWLKGVMNLIKRFFVR